MTSVLLYRYRRAIAATDISASWRIPNPSDMPLADPGVQGTEQRTSPLVDKEDSGPSTYGSSTSMSSGNSPRILLR